MTVPVPAYPIGVDSTGLVTFSPGEHGHLRLTGTAVRQARRMIRHWEADVDYAVLTAHGSRILLGMGIFEQHTFTDSLPESAMVMRGLLAELNERLDADPDDATPPVVIVLEAIEELLAPADDAPGPDGSLHELERHAALYLRAGINLLAHRGPAVGMSLLAIHASDFDTFWPDTLTLDDGDAGPTYQRDGQPVPLTWV